MSVFQFYRPHKVEACEMLPMNIKLLFPITSLVRKSYSIKCLHCRSNQSPWAKWMRMWESQRWIVTTSRNQRAWGQSSNRKWHRLEWWNFVMFRVKWCRSTVFFRFIPTLSVDHKIVFWNWSGKHNWGIWIHVLVVLADVRQIRWNPPIWMCLVLIPRLQYLMYDKLIKFWEAVDFYSLHFRRCPKKIGMHTLTKIHWSLFFFLSVTHEVYRNRRKFSALWDTWKFAFTGDWIFPCSYWHLGKFVSLTKFYRTRVQ